MNFVSLAEACRRLSIDVKTLHRWLADAHLSLLCHPYDGRKKGVSQEHLQVLARLHHRRLATCEEEEPVPPPSQIPALPADLLALTEQLAALQAQIATLEQQVVDLTRLLTALKPEPVCPLPATKPKPSVQHARSAVRSRPAVSKPKTPAKPVHVIARVEYSQDGHYAVICPQKGLLPLEPDSEEWFAWVAEQGSFRFVGKQGSFTAHHERRVPKGAWRAHRHIRNHNYIQRLAPHHELTIAVLEQAAHALQAHLL